MLQFRKSKFIFNIVWQTIEDQAMSEFIFNETTVNKSNVDEQMNEATVN